MNRNNNYEQIRFDKIINTVSQKQYPESFPMHWHKYAEIIVVPEDAGEEVQAVIRLNQKLYQLHGGDILLIWPGELHEVTDNRKKNIAALQFPLTLLSEIQDFVLYSNLFRAHHLLMFQKTPELNQMMLFSISQIFRLVMDGDRQFPNVEMLISFYEMFLTFGNYLHERMELLNSQKDGADKMQLACAYIQENCESNITLEKVAEQVGFSACYFSRCFKKVIGYSFVEYLMMQRVKRMNILLTNPELSITDAAYQAGFKSISSLNRIFKQYSGCSPSEYRKYYNVNN